MQLLYKVSVIARFLNLTERRVQQLARDGIIPKAEKGKYDLVGCVQGYIAYLQARAFGKDSESIDMHAERSRLLKLQADRAQMELDVMLSKLIPAEEAEELWAGLLATFRTRMLAVPTRAAHLVLHLKEFIAIEQQLRDLVRDALTELARYDPKQHSRPNGVETRPEPPESTSESEGEPVVGRVPLSEQ